MTLIKSRLISPKESLNRKLRKEQSQWMPVMVNLCNDYLMELNKNTPDTLPPVWDSCCSRWDSFVDRWNADASKLTELHKGELEMFMLNHLENLRKDEKNKLWEAFGTLLRPFIDGIRIRSSKGTQSDSIGMHKD